MQRIQFPPQHGAWAFLIVPLLLTALLGATSWLALVFAVTWICAYPTSYYGSRAVFIRIRRGQWSRLAKAARSAALPWLAVTIVGSAVLIVFRPVLILAGLVVLALWSVSVWLAWIGRERGITNDLVLVVIAAVAVPLMWLVGHDTIELRIWVAAFACAVFFTGSVLHVKSLIREADDARWHVASIGYHFIALIVMSVISPWFILAFLPALARTLFMKPGLRPGTIGGVEAVVSLLFLIAGVLALG